MGLHLHVRVSRGTLQAFGDTEWQVAAEGASGPESDAEPASAQLDVDGSNDDDDAADVAAEDVESGDMDDAPGFDGLPD